MISLIIVNYRSADLTIAALASARRATASAIQTIVVDNSLDPAEAERIRPHADLVIESSSNRGYGGAANDARPRVEWPTIVIANADVAFGPESLDRLTEALLPGVAVAGPALYWDDAHKWILPPADAFTYWEKLGEAVATRSAAWKSWRDRRRTRARIAFWQLRRTTRVAAVSGAVMAMPVSEFDAAGGFDERFPLYFEETDLLRRVRSGGKAVMYVPAARCRHLFNQSAGADSERAATLYAASERAFLEKWYGKPARSLLAAVARSRVERALPPSDSVLRVRPGEVLIEASPLADFRTAAGHFPDGTSVEIPREVWEAYRSPVLYVRSVEIATARVLATWALRRS